MNDPPPQIARKHVYIYIKKRKTLNPSGDSKMDGLSLNEGGGQKQILSNFGSGQLKVRFVF